MGSKLKSLPHCFLVGSLSRVNDIYITPDNKFCHEFTRQVLENGVKEGVGVGADANPAVTLGHGLVQRVQHYLTVTGSAASQGI